MSHLPEQTLRTGVQFCLSVGGLYCIYYSILESSSCIIHQYTSITHHSPFVLEALGQHADKSRTPPPRCETYTALDITTIKVAMIYVHYV